MITILARKHIRNDAQGRDIARVYISVSSSSELPAQDAIPNIIIAEGSKAWDISTGDEYGFIVGQGWNKQPAGVSDYEALENLPQINSVTLIGNKSLSDLGIVNPMIIKGRVDTIADLANVQNPQPGWVYFVGTSGAAELEEYVYIENGNSGSWQFLGYNTIVIDSSLSTTSENPVQNKVITSALDGLMSYDSTNAKLKKTVGGVTSDVMAVDTTPTANSKNPVTSGAVNAGLALKADLSILTPISESAYEALQTYTNPLYFIYEDTV